MTMQEMYKIIGNKLKKARKIKKININDVATFLSGYGITYSKDTIYKWEQGFSMPSINIIILLCKLYKCPIEFIIEDSVINAVNLSAKELFLLDQYRYNKYAKNISDIMYDMYLYEIKVSNGKK